MSAFPPGTQSGISTGQDLVGVQLNEVRKDILALQAAGQATTSVQVTIPEPRSPFVTSYEKIKGHLRGTCNINIPNPCDEVIIQIIRQSDRVDQPTFDTSVQTSDPLIPTDAELAAGVLNQRMSFDLDTNTTYDLVRLIAKGTTSGKVKDPPGDILFTDPPLASFTTPASLANAPSAPTSGRVVANTTDATADGVVGATTLRIYAEEAQVKTFNQQQTVAVQPKLVKAIGGEAARKPVVNVDDPSATFIDVVIGDLQIGREYDWVKNTTYAANGDGVDATAAGTVAIFAGGFADPSDGLANLTLVSFTGTAQPDGSILLVITLHQPTVPYRLKNGFVERKLSSEATSVFNGNVIVDLFPLQDPVYNVAGNIVLTLGPVPAKAAKVYDYRLTVKAVGNVTKQFTSGDIAAGALQIVAGTGVAAPSLVNGGGMYASKNDYNQLYGGTSVPADAKYLGRRWEIVANSGVKIDNLAAGGGGSLDTNGLQWRDTESRLMFNTDCFTKGGKPACILSGKFLRPDQVYTFGCQLICDTADVTENITIAFYDQTNAADIVAVTINGVVISHLAQVWFMCIFTIPHGYVNAGKQWIEWRMGSNPTNKTYSTQWNLQPGIVDITKWAPNTEEALITPGNITYHGEGLNQNANVVIVGSDGSVFDANTTKGGILPL